MGSVIDYHIKSMLELFKNFVDHVENFLCSVIRNSEKLGRCFHLSSFFHLSKESMMYRVFTRRVYISTIKLCSRDVYSSRKHPVTNGFYGFFQTKEAL